MKDFKMSGTNMNQLLTDLQAVQKNLNNSYGIISNLMSRVEEEQAWEGKAKDTFWAYMGLLQQYHKCFADEEEDNNNPIKLAVDALNKLNTNVEDFYTDYLEYCNMEKIE